MQHNGSRALAVHRYLFRLALAAGNLYGWITVFLVALIFTRSVALGLVATAILYALAQGIAFILTPLTGAALRFGARRALILGSIAGAISFAFLAQVFLSRFSQYPDVGLSLLAGFAVFNGIQRALYFVPYASAVALTGSGTRHEFAREISLALVPLFGALIITSISGGIGLLFALAAALALAAAFALAGFEETYERFSWTSLETYRALFSNAHQPALRIAILDGIQGVTLLLIWPLAAFLILNQSFVAFGAVMSLTLLGAFVGRRATRRALRALKVEDSPYVLATIAFSSWIVRLAAGSAVQIVIADVYYHAAAKPRQHGVDTHASDQWADNAHYVDEFTALKEMGLAIGRIFACIIFAAAAYIFLPLIAFAVLITIAAVASAASVLLSHRLSKQAF